MEFYLGKDRIFLIIIKINKLAFHKISVLYKKNKIIKKLIIKKLI